MLAEQLELDVFGVKYVIDRIVYRTEFYDDEIMVLANKDTEFKGFKICKKLFLSIYIRILKEEKSGALKGWCLVDGLRDDYKEIGTDYDRNYIAI
jgi:hypothetical protein